MTVCDSLFSVSGLRPHTMRILIGLLASTGLRPGEAVRLKQPEVKRTEGELVICGSKGWVRRLVPASSGTIAALIDYLDDLMLGCHGKPLSIISKNQR